MRLLLTIPTIDLRSNRLFTQSHIINSVNIPVNELENSLYELPMSSQPIQLFGLDPEIQQATKFLLSKNYQVKESLIANKQNLLKLEEMELMTTGKSTDYLWQPASIVKRFIDEITQKNGNNKGLDIACGAGRDSVYLSINGWSMTSIDYLPSALNKLTQLAKKHQQDIQTVQFDLESNNAELSQFMKLNTATNQSFNGLFGCVIVVRYLHRPLLKQLKSLIDVGGYIVYQTFMQGCEVFGSPKNPRYLLKPGELAREFSDFSIVIDEVITLDDGRPTNCFIAQRIK